VPGGVLSSQRIAAGAEGGIAYRVWELNPRLRVYHAFFNSLLVYTHDEELLHAMIARFNGQARGHFTPLPSRSEFVAYLNPALIRNACREVADTLAASGDRAISSPASIVSSASCAPTGFAPTKTSSAGSAPKGRWCQLRTGARLPDVALVVELQNPDVMPRRLDVAMTALKAATDIATPWDTTQFHDVTLRTLRLRTTVPAPTYFTSDKFFVLASSPDYARELVGHLRELVPGLATSADYQKAMKRLPTGAVAYTYCNLRAVAPPLLAALRNDKLPAPETLARHLGPFGSANLGDTTITISPLGEPATVALAGWFAARPHLAEPETRK